MHCHEREVGVRPLPLAQHHSSVAGLRCILYADRSVRTSKTRKEIMSENRSTAQPTAAEVFPAADILLLPILSTEWPSGSRRRPPKTYGI